MDPQRLYKIEKKLEMIVIMEVDAHCNGDSENLNEEVKCHSPIDQQTLNEEMKCHCPVDQENVNERVDCNVLTEAKQENHVSPKDEMLNLLAKSRVVYFKSQQVGEPELNFDQKRKIASDILSNSPSQFLARFGQHILERHLDIFTDMEMDSESCYEVSFHMKQLRRFHCKAKNQVDIKNRRFEALKKLVSEGSYFSEKEMKKRNPLLYDQLIGRYLSPEEVEIRERETMNSISSFVALMLAKIERDEENCLRKQQKDDEDGAIEEVDTSEEESESEMESEEESKDRDEEEYTDKEDDEAERREAVRLHLTRKKVSDKEKNLLREEFVSNMYNSFLEGRDADFDYSAVDWNPDFENLAVRAQDEEEKYFDSETPELVGSQEDEEAEAEEEDELDKYMLNLKPESTPSDLANDLVNL